MGTIQLKLELYAPNVKTAFVRAQELADRRKNVEVTPHHLLRAMLDRKWGYAPCIRAGVRPEKLLAEATVAIDGLSSQATEPACLGRTVLAAMSRAERLLVERGRDYVDFQLVYQALAAEGACPAAIGDGAWSKDECLGSPAAPTLAEALHTSAPIPAVTASSDTVLSDFGRSAVRYAGRVGDLWFASALHEGFLLSFDARGNVVERFSVPPVDCVRNGVAVQWAYAWPGRVPGRVPQGADSSRAVGYELRTGKELWKLFGRVPTARSFAVRHVASSMRSFVPLVSKTQPARGISALYEIEARPLVSAPANAAPCSAGPARARPRR